MRGFEEILSRLTKSKVLPSRGSISRCCGSFVVVDVEVGIGAVVVHGLGSCLGFLSLLWLWKDRGSCLREVVYAVL